VQRGSPRLRPPLRARNVALSSRWSAKSDGRCRRPGAVESTREGRVPYHSVGFQDDVGRPIRHRLATPRLPHRPTAHGPTGVRNRVQPSPRRAGGSAIAVAGPRGWVSWQAGGSKRCPGCSRRGGGRALSTAPAALDAGAAGAWRRCVTAPWRGPRCPVVAGVKNAICAEPRGVDPGAVVRSAGGGSCCQHAGDHGMNWARRAAGRGRAETQRAPGGGPEGHFAVRKKRDKRRKRPTIDDARRPTGWPGSQAPRTAKPRAVVSRACAPASRFTNPVLMTCLPQRGKPPSGLGPARAGACCITKTIYTRPNGRVEPPARWAGAPRGLAETGPAW